MNVETNVCRNTRGSLPRNKDSHSWWPHKEGPGQEQARPHCQPQDASQRQKGHQALTRHGLRRQEGQVHALHQEARQAWRQARRCLLVNLYFPNQIPLFQFNSVKAFYIVKNKTKRVTGLWKQPCHCADKVPAR